MILIIIFLLSSGLLLLYPELVRGSSRDAQDFLSADTFLLSADQLFGEYSKALPGPPRDIVSPACPGSASRGNQKQMHEPLQMTSFNMKEQWLYSELLLSD